MNAIGTQLRDSINSGLTRWRMAVLNKQMDAAAEPGRNPVRKTSTKFSLSMEMSRLTRDGTTEPVLRDQILDANGDRNIFIFPDQLTTCRIGNLTGLIHILSIAYMYRATSG